MFYIMKKNVMKHTKRVKDVNKPLYLNVSAVLAARTKMQSTQNKLYTTFGIVDPSENNLLNKYKNLDESNKEKLLDILSGPEKRTINLTRGYFDRKLQVKQ